MEGGSEFFWDGDLRILHLAVLNTVIAAAMKEFTSPQIASVVTWSGRLLCRRPYTARVHVSSFNSHVTNLIKASSGQLT